MDKPATTSSATPAKNPNEEKRAEPKKKQYRELRAKITAMRKSSRAAAAERKVLEARLVTMASELGLPAPGSKKAANAGAGK